MAWPAKRSRTSTQAVASPAMALIADARMRRATSSATRRLISVCVTASKMIQDPYERVGHEARAE